MLEVRFMEKDMSQVNMQLEGSWMSTLQLISGFVLALAVPITGLLMTGLIENAIAIITAVAAVCFLGVILTNSSYKMIGIGIFLGFIPLILIIGYVNFLNAGY